MFNIIKRYYEKGIYLKADVKVFVRSGDINTEQYKEITGDDYVI